MITQPSAPGRGTPAEGEAPSPARRRGIRALAVTAGLATALSLAFETALQAKERVIRELEARLVDMQAALDHERESSRRLSDALTREQTLRALPPPQADPPDPLAAAAEQPANSAPERPESAGGGTSTPDAPDPPQSRAEGRIRAFWQRLWGRPSG